MSDTALTRSSRSNAIYEAPSNIEQIKSGKVKENEKVESVQPVQPKEKPTVQKTDLKSSGEMVIELDNSIHEAESKPIQELNTRGSKVFNQPILQQDADDIVLSETIDDAKPVQYEDNSKLLQNAVQDGVSKLVKSLDGTLMKEGVYKKAETFGKSLVENMDPKSKLAFDFTLKSKDEIKESVATSVFGLKEKYSPKYEELKVKHNSEVETRKELVEFIKDFPSLRKKDPEKAQELKAEFMKKLEAFDPNTFSAYKKNMTENPNMLLEPVRIRVPQPPKFYDALPPNKQVLVDRIVQGMESASPPNRINQMLDPSTLEPKQQEKLKSFFHNDGDTVDIPASVEFQGKTYTFDRFLGGGGDGVAFSMKSGDEKIVVKAPIFDPSVKNILSIVNNNMKSETLAHISGMGDGNKNVLEMKGVIKGPNTLMTVTEFAKGGELNDVVDKINTTPITEENSKILKLVLAKDSIQGLQFVQTERNMSHYDVKPKNFFVSEDGSSKLSDFGKAGLGHKVECGQMTPAYMPEDAKPFNVNYKPSEKIDTFAMGISLDQILNNVNYDDENVTYQRKEDTPLNKLISKMTSDEPSERPTLTAVLQHSTFNNPILNNPAVVDKSHELVSAIIDGRQDDIGRLNDELTELLKK